LKDNTQNQNGGTVKPSSTANVIPMDAETEKLLKELWYKRNPCHELNADTENDMYWGTVICVINDLIENLSKSV